MKEERKTIKKAVLNVVRLLLIGVFLFSGYKIYGIFSEYEKGSSEYTELREKTIKINVPTGKKDNLPEDEPAYQVDFVGLQKENPDVIGWIRFDEPEEINYPVVKGKDNEKYLKETFGGNKNSAGTLFVDCHNASDFNDKNTFIYGHNMKNGTMFGQLKKYKEESFCKENPYFYIYTLDGREITYQIFACSIVKDTAESYKRTYGSVEEFQQYIKHIRKVSRYATDVLVDVNSQIVSLSTCTNVKEDERILVHGVKVNEK